MTRERGQALVEAVLAVPACLACALTIVDAGVLIRDRIAVAQAATRAAEARLEGRDAVKAARSALPARLAARVDVDATGGRVVVRATSRTALTRIAGRAVTHRSIVEVDSTGGAR